MEQSILKTVKAAVNVALDDPSFDLAIIGHINTEFSTLADLGVGPPEGFVIEDDVGVWGDYLDPDDNKIMLSQIKTAVILRTRILFDPPAQIFLLQALKDQLLETEWRINVNRETVEWVDPAPPDLLIVDGGDPSGE